MEKKLKYQNLLLLLLCAMCWGPSYLFIKISVTEIPPITLVLLRVGIAAMLLCCICFIQKHNIFAWKHLWKQFAVMGITLNALPFFLISYGELFISSSLAGIINSFTLIFTAIIGHYFGQQERLTRNKVLGICIGLIGLGVIYLPMLFHENAHADLGALMIVCACLSYGTGSVYARTHIHNVPSVVALTFQLIIATVILLPLSLFIDQPFKLPTPSLSAIMGALGLGVIGTAAGFFFYFKAIQRAGATYASLTVLLVPILAMLYGVIFLNEYISWNLYLGTLLIISGILFIHKKIA